MDLTSSSIKNKKLMYPKHFLQINQIKKSHFHQFKPKIKPKTYKNKKREIDLLKSFDLQGEDRVLVVLKPMSLCLLEGPEPGTGKRCGKNHQYCTLLWSCTLGGELVLNTFVVPAPLQQLEGIRRRPRIRIVFMSWLILDVLRFRENI